MIANIETNVSIPSAEAPKTVIHSGDQALSRGNFIEAQKAYREAIQTGLGTNEIWLNYDRSLILRMFQGIDTDPSLLQPSNSNRHEQLIDIKPVNTEQNSDYMTDEEWQQMQQDAYEWLGC